MSAAALIELRQALERRFPDTLPLARGIAAAVATGLGPLDAVLPGGGLARGRVTLWAPGGGATAVLRSACEAAVARGERAAWIMGREDGGAAFWREGPLLVRPESERQALVSAEELLRSGGMSLVVLTGTGREGAREAVRLSRAARAGGASFVMVGSEATVSHLRVRSRIRPDGYRWRYGAFGDPVEVEAVRVEVEASSLGWSGRAVLELPVRLRGARVAPEPALVDRRGAPAAVRWRRTRQGRRRAPGAPAG